MSKKPKDITPEETLDADDADLWKRVADSAEPLVRGKNRLSHTPRIEKPKAEPAQRPSKPTAKKLVPAKPAEPPVPSAPPPLASIDRREARGLSSGRVDIGARVDLHGMRQGEAHGALRSFLFRAQAQGHRHVLVITGKGRKQDDRGLIERGVLNREVPRWLGEPDLRNVVVGFSPAHKRHGGEGALYVRLRKNRPGRD